MVSLAATAFSNPSDLGNIDKLVLTAFDNAYTGAKDIKWESVGNYSKATFQLDGRVMYAYFNEEGEEIASARNISPSQLPSTLGNELKIQCGDNRWITELFELTSNGDTTYFATLYSADRIIVLKGDSFRNWTVFQKRKRTE